MSGFGDIESLTIANGPKRNRGQSVREGGQLETVIGLKMCGIVRHRQCYCFAACLLLGSSCLVCASALVGDASNCCDHELQRSGRFLHAFRIWFLIADEIH